MNSLNRRSLRHISAERPGAMDRAPIPSTITNTAKIIIKSVRYRERDPLSPWLLPMAHSLIAIATRLFIVQQRIQNVFYKNPLRNDSLLIRATVIFLSSCLVSVAFRHPYLNFLQSLMI